jgi:hypothetical protein
VSVIINHNCQKSISTPIKCLPYMPHTLHAIACRASRVGVRARLMGST